MNGIAAATTHVADISRATWSMPPAHGAGIVATILGDDALRAEWEAELTSMRERMISLRKALSGELVQRTGSNLLASLATQNGMFSQLPVTPESAKVLREESGLYMPGIGPHQHRGPEPEGHPAHRRNHRDRALSPPS